METQRPGWTVIGVEDLEDFGDVDQALIGFYESAVAKAVADSGVSERKLRAWFDGKLITPAHTRGLVYRDSTETEGLPNTAVDVLDRSYIIRPSKRGDDTWYELAHDRLVEPILAANRTWQATYTNPLVVLAQVWLKSGRDPAKLVDGRQLAEAEDFAKEHSVDLLPEEMDLLKESRRMEVSRQAQERQKTKRRQDLHNCRHSRDRSARRAHRLGLAQRRRGQGGRRIGRTAGTHRHGARIGCGGDWQRGYRP